MLQSSLTYQGEHDAWKQRVNKGKPGYPNHHN